MNYRHAFHAGNFADVLKHAVLAQVVRRLRDKPAPFRAIDLHAGAGLYDLASAAAERTGEWRRGIGRILAAAPDPALAAFLEPYLGVVRALRSRRRMLYPGSPALVRALLRPQDRLVLCELHPAEIAALRGVFARDARVKILELDGWTAAKSLLPPPERRGLTLIDPPHEAPDDFDRTVRALVDAHRRFATGIVIAWYPIKDAAEAATFREAAIATGIRRILGVEMSVGLVAPDRPLAACGLTIVNPPWRLDEALAAAAPRLAAILADGGGAAEVSWLVPE